MRSRGICSSSQTYLLLFSLFFVCTGEGEVGCGLRNLINFELTNTFYSFSNLSISKKNKRDMLPSTYISHFCYMNQTITCLLYEQYYVYKNDIVLCN